MPTETTYNGYITLKHPPVELAEHGLHHSANQSFYNAMLDVIELLRAECLIRECHPIHEKLVDLAGFIRAGHCQDFVATHYPASF